MSDCTTTVSGTCTPTGEPRRMLHVCTLISDHRVPVHKCACGRTWPRTDEAPTSTPDDIPPTRRRGARRRWPA